MTQYSGCHNDNSKERTQASMQRTGLQASDFICDLTEDQKDKCSFIPPDL